jgi:hypothetical protein
MTDMHTKISKKYTSKAAQAYRTELAKLVDAEAAKRGEGPTPADDAAGDNSDLLANLELADKAEQDSEARAKLAAARAASSQPATAKAQLASTLPGAKKLMVTPPSSGNAPKLVLRKPAGSSGSLNNMMKKKPAGAGGSKLRINKLSATPTKDTEDNNNNTASANAKDDFNHFEDHKPAEEEAAPPVPAPAPAKAPPATTSNNNTVMTGITNNATSTPAPKPEKEQFNMNAGVNKLKMMNSDFFSGF